MRGDPGGFTDKCDLGWPFEPGKGELGGVKNGDTGEVLGFFAGDACGVEVSAPMLSSKGEENLYGIFEIFLSSYVVKSFIATAHNSKNESTSSTGKFSKLCNQGHRDRNML